MQINGHSIHHMVLLLDWCLSAELHHQGARRRWLRNGSEMEVLLSRVWQELVPYLQGR
jgi:hypothetical protein